MSENIMLFNLFNFMLCVGIYRGGYRLSVEYHERFKRVKIRYLKFLFLFKKDKLFEHTILPTIILQSFSILAFLIVVSLSLIIGESIIYINFLGLPFFESFLFGMVIFAMSIVFITVVIYSYRKYIVGNKEGMYNWKNDLLDYFGFPGIKKVKAKVLKITKVKRNKKGEVFYYLCTMYLTKSKKIIDNVTCYSSYLEENQIVKITRIRNDDGTYTYIMNSIIF